MRHLISTSILILAGLLAFGQVPIAAEADAGSDSGSDAGKKAPVDISPKDPVAAGKAKHAFEQENPCAADARQELLDALSRVHNELETSGAVVDGAEDRPESLGIPDLGLDGPELMETRDLIDEVDLELIRLLARRAHLSKRAGSIKAIHGKSVRDPQRERTLLEQRRQWAGEHNLEPDSIDDIFAAVLRFSRALQTR